MIHLQCPLFKYNLSERGGVEWGGGGHMNESTEMSD